MINISAIGLEKAFEPREHLLLEQGIARFGYADDLHLDGEVSAFSRRWNMVLGALASAGLALQRGSLAVLVTYRRLATTPYPSQSILQWILSLPTTNET